MNGLADKLLQVSVQPVRGSREQAVRLAIIFDELCTSDMFGGRAPGDVDRHRFVRRPVNDERRHGEGSQVRAEIGFAERVDAVQRRLGAGRRAEQEAPV